MCATRTAYHMTVNCAIEQQGALLALANKSTAPILPDARRGRVVGFSPASRLRLIRKLARINASSALFLTLTFPERYPDASQAKEHLRAFFERLRRRWPRIAAIWRMEAQERGAPHYHILLFNTAFIPIQTVREWWEEICSDYMDGSPIQIRLVKCRSARRVMAYVSKYTAKLDEHAYRHYDAELFLDDGVYLHAGRQWGIHNKDCIPWPVRQFLTFDGSPDDLFTLVKSMMRERWEYLNEMPDRGGVIFAADAPYLFLKAATILSGG